MNRVMRGAVVVFAIWALNLGHGARGGPITVGFDEKQLVNNDPLQTFYAGGKTYRGVSGGPNYGISFTLNARVFTDTSGLVGTFTKPGIMELYSDTAVEGEKLSATMNVKSGFVSSMSFDYAAIDAAGKLKVYSGLDGTGTLLTTLDLPVTSPLTGPGTFVADQVKFSGIAHSIVFDGGNKQLAIDDLTLSLTPEPPSWLLLATGALLLGVVHIVRRVPVHRADRRAS